MKILNSFSLLRDVKNSPVLTTVYSTMALMQWSTMCKKVLIDGSADFISLYNLKLAFIFFLNSCFLDGEKIPCLLYADDLVLFSDTKNGLQQKLNILNNILNALNGV
jgi:hypothetical protein